jgi:hypothetical protein
MFHLHPSGNGRCGSNGLSLLKACAIQPLRATLGVAAETNCLGLGQRAATMRPQCRSFCRAWRGTSGQGSGQERSPGRIAGELHIIDRMDWRIRLSDVPVGVGRPSDANGSPPDGAAGSASPRSITASSSSVRRPRLHNLRGCTTESYPMRCAAPVGAPTCALLIQCPSPLQ